MWRRRVFLPWARMPVLAADDLLGDPVEVIVGVRDHGAGDLEDEVDRGGEVPGMDVQVDRGSQGRRRRCGREGFPSVESGRRPRARAGPEGPRLARTRWVTFDQITGPSWVRPAGFDALHHADRGPDRAR